MNVVVIIVQMQFVTITSMKGIIEEGSIHKIAYYCYTFHESISTVDDRRVDDL
jgi:hypothetical protein